MEFLVSASTDIGISKKTNQDSYSVTIVDTRLGKMVIAVLCDGMGGLSKGEIASATVIDAFRKWIVTRLPELCKKSITDTIIQNEWCDIAIIYNEKIKNYGKSVGIDLGTTLVAILLTDSRYYIINIGDSRVYEITDKVVVLTKDQTVVARETELGIISEEQAKTDPRRSVLLQCIGASDEIAPDVFFGETKKDAVYMLCSDGFRHEISIEEIQQYLNPEKMHKVDQMKQNMDFLIEINKQRMERDNISVVSIRTY
ncbi:MAG: protein phosphatase 2C domain-containing protein [Oscillospiraceae bacterium]|nr:protein phosphatase 2C domain-containing protein [Oscillospiraceae bacterium]